MLLLLLSTKTRMVSEAELSLAAKSANSAFPTTSIKTLFGVKRAVQGSLSSCKHPGRAGAEGQNKAQKSVWPLRVAGMLCRDGIGAFRHSQGRSGEAGRW